MTFKCAKTYTSNFPALRKSVTLHFFFLFTAAPAAYGSSQAKAGIRVEAADLHHSHSNARSKPRLRPLAQLVATPDA